MQTIQGGHFFLQQYQAGVGALCQDERVNLLEEIITGATDDSVSTGNLLRKVTVVAHYLRAKEVADWVKGELNGYKTVESLPNYRHDLLTPVMGTWTGYFGTSATQLVSSLGLPEEADMLFKVSFFQPISELEELVLLPKDPAQAWDPWQVAQFNKWNQEGKGVWMENMSLLNAHRVVTRASIRGVIDTIRNTALDLALNLHTTDEHAGTLHGPTIADAPIATTINNFTTHVYGHGANVAFGDNATLRSRVVVNDVESLLTAARDLGLTDEGIAELRAAAEAPEPTRPSLLKEVAKRVGSGALVLTNAVAAEVAGSQLDMLVQQFLGQL